MPHSTIGPPVLPLDPPPRALGEALAFHFGKGARAGFRGAWREFGVVLGRSRAVGPRGEVVLPRGTDAQLVAGIERANTIGLECGFMHHGTRVTLHPLDRPFPAVAVAATAGRVAPTFGPELLEELELRALPRASASDPFLPLHATSPALAPILEALRRVARSPLPVLLLGETGTGKELLARAVHLGSGRTGPFVAENCAALPESLLEAELFGAKRGAYTGADRDRRGRIAEADRGTLFLDEVGDLPLPLQAKLLRVLQEKELRPLGSERSIRIDLRVVAATHAPLRERARSGLFRNDLYYRLAGFVCDIPPLRERRSDLPFLCSALLARAEADGIGPGRRLAVGALERLAGYAFPGNVRELENLLRRAATLAESHTIPHDAFPNSGDGPQEQQNLEALMIRQALRQSGGIKAEAARRLGWSRQKLYRRLDALGIPHRRQRTDAMSGPTLWND